MIKSIFCLFFLIFSTAAVFMEPGPDSSSSLVPHWLRSLVCCAAFLQSAEFSIHSTAVAAVVDLASLLLTSLEVRKNLGSSSQFITAGRSAGAAAEGDAKTEEMVFVMIRPLVTEAEFRALLVDTLVTQVCQNFDS